MGRRSPAEAEMFQAGQLLSRLSASGVAEGVEQTDQLDALRALGCDAGQGFLWGAAARVDELEDLLAGLACWTR